MSEAVLKVAIDAPLSRLFDYLPPARGGVPLPGSRVLVPFGRRKLVGLVLGRAAAREPPAAKLPRTLPVLDDAPLLRAPGPHLPPLVRRHHPPPHRRVGGAAPPAPPR